MPQPINPTDGRPIGQAAIQTTQIVNLLSSTQFGQQFTYGEISNGVGFDVQHPPGNGYLQSAKRILRRDKGMVFVTIRGVGIKRVANQGIIDKAGAGVTAVRRRMRDDLKTLACADPSTMSQAEKTAFNTTLSHVGVISHMSKPYVQKRLEKAVEKTQQKLPIDATLGMFLGTARENGKTDGERRQE